MKRLRSDNPLQLHEAEERDQCDKKNDQPRHHYRLQRPVAKTGDAFRERLAMPFSDERLFDYVKYQQNRREYGGLEQDRINERLVLVAVADMQSLRDQYDLRPRLGR